MARIVERVNFNTPKIKKLKRVAAYARVSNGKDAMLHSLSAQIDYYRNLIFSNPEWRFCGVYADEAMTGTKDNRDNFQKMLTECRAGNLNLIITKSISRFARNTVTLLETVRELKNLGVDVLFEEQNIHSLSSDGELMLSILASYAQEESLSASENQKWRIRKDFEQGKVSSLQMLGYKRNHDGVLEIIPDEVEIVRLIFNSYLSGMGKLAIANMLNEMHISTKFDNEWTAEAVRRILTNEKYCGELMLQKFYSENHLTKRKMVNHGEIKKFYVEEAHPPIIEKTVFLAVQNLMKKHQEQFSSKKSTTVVYPFTGKIQCQCCGKNYRRKTTATGVVWICATYNTKGKKYCPTAKQIPENTLIAVCCEALNISEFDANIFENQIEKILVPKPNELTFIFTDGHEVSANWKDRSRSESWTDEMKKATAESLSDTSAIDKKIEKLAQELSVIESMNRELVIELAQSAKRPEDYNERRNELTKEYDEKFGKFQKLEQKRTDQLNRAEALQNMIQQLSETKSVIDTFDDSLWRTMIEKVTVFHDNRMIFQFLDGTEIEA